MRTYAGDGLAKEIDFLTGEVTFRQAQPHELPRYYDGPVSFAGDAEPSSTTVQIDETSTPDAEVIPLPAEQRRAQTAPSLGRFAAS